MRKRIENIAIYISMILQPRQLISIVRQHEQMLDALNKTVKQQFEEMERTQRILEMERDQYISGQKIQRHKQGICNGGCGCAI